MNDENDDHDNNKDEEDDNDNDNDDDGGDDNNDDNNDVPVTSWFHGNKKVCKFVRLWFHQQICQPNKARSNATLRCVLIMVADLLESVGTDMKHIQVANLNTSIWPRMTSNRSQQNQIKYHWENVFCGFRKKNRLYKSFEQY